MFQINLKKRILKTKIFSLPPLVTFFLLLFFFTPLLSHSSHSVEKVNLNEEKFEKEINEENGDEVKIEEEKSIHQVPIKNQEHMKEHLEEEGGNFTEMTPEEMEFYFFNIHDIDNDSRLDGLEIFKAFVHMNSKEEFEQYSAEFFEKIQRKRYEKGLEPLSKDMLRREKNKLEKKYFSAMVDNILKTDDVNRDGYISYREFVEGKKRAHNISRVREKQFF